MNTKDTGESKNTSRELRTVPMAEIQANPENARIFNNTPEEHKRLETLAASMKGEGLLQPIVISPIANPAPDSPVKYTLVGGERRWRAATILGWSTIPANVYVTPIADDARAILNLRENIDREDLTGYEKAMGYARLVKKYGMTTAQIGSEFSITKSNVAAYVRYVNNLCPAILTAWKKGDELCSFHNLNKAAQIADHAEQLKAWKKFIETGFWGDEGDDADDKDDGDKDDGDKGDGDKGGKRKKPSEKKLIALHKALKDLPGEKHAIAAECLRYVLGKRKTPPIEIPEPEAKAPTTHRKKGEVKNVD